MANDTLYHPAPVIDTSKGRYGTMYQNLCTQLNLNFMLTE